MVEKPKVAQVITVSSSLNGLMLNQMRSLQRAGYEVVGISSPGPEIPAVEVAGIRHIAVSISRDVAPWADLRTLAQLYRVFRAERFTVVHTHLAKAALLGPIAARLAGVPVVINTVHGYHFHDGMAERQRRFFIALEKFGARCCDSILSQNQEDLQTAIREGISTPEKLHHIGNGIDLTRFDPNQVDAAAVQAQRAELGIDPDAPVVGFVGRLAAKRKGFLDFLHAAQQLAARRPDVQFLIAGEPDYGKPDAVEPAAASAFGIDKQCHFIGFRPNGEMPLWYKMMNVLVLPSPFEGIPRTVMEASALGVPVVASDVRGNREAVQEGQTGYLVPFGDVTALAGAILRLVADPDAVQRMGCTGREVAQSCFDERQVFARVHAIYADLLMQKGLVKTEQWSKSTFSKAGDLG